MHSFALRPEAGIWLPILTAAKQSLALRLLPKRLARQSMQQRE
jgi:hypothetical protein